MTRSRPSSSRWSIVLACGVAATLPAVVRGQDRGDARIDAVLEVLESLRGGTAGLPDAVCDADYAPRHEAREALGRLLFHDKLLSGNLNTSCATCHHPLADTGDGLSLPVGEGARGLGVTRDTGTGADAVPERVPRNAPPVFNLGAFEFEVMFHDGRVEVDPSQPSGYRSPAGADLPSGLDSALAAQAMFPVTSGTEMAGQGGENAVANAAAAGDLPLVWALLVQRIASNGDYVGMFMDAFADIQGPGDITFVHAANAIAAYEAFAYRADGSPFDRFLRHEPQALSQRARHGMNLFYGRARCSSCHSGPFQTDHDFHALAMPQIGPGKGDNLPGYTDGHDDFGRAQVTSESVDRFRFRTPTLRNVALTGPWGHDGAYDTLEAVVGHMLDPVDALNGYDPDQAVLPPRPDLDAQDFVAWSDGARRAAVADACELAPRALRPKEIDALVDFLHALTDPRALDLRSEVPMSVPSGLPVWD